MGIGNDMLRGIRRQGCILDWTSEDLGQGVPFFPFIFFFFLSFPFWLVSPAHYTYTLAAGQQVTRRNAVHIAASESQPVTPPVHHRVPKSASYIIKLGYNGR